MYLNTMILDSNEENNFFLKIFIEKRFGLVVLCGFTSDEYLEIYGSIPCADRVVSTYCTDIFPLNKAEKCQYSKFYNNRTRNKAILSVDCCTFLLFVYNYYFRKGISIFQ